MAQRHYLALNVCLQRRRIGISIGTSNVDSQYLMACVAAARDDRLLCLVAAVIYLIKQPDENCSAEAHYCADAEAKKIIDFNQAIQRRIGVIDAGIGAL